MAYGDAFPAFLGRHALARDLPWRPDVAALEVARGQAYHAADAEPLPPGFFAELPAERVGALRLRLYPAVILLRSAHPVVTLWDGDAPRAASWVAEDALVHRRGIGATATRLEPGQAAVLRPTGSTRAMRSSS